MYAKSYNMFPRTIKSLIIELKKAFNDLHSFKLSPEEFSSLIISWANNVENKFITNNSINPTVKLRLGIKKTQLLTKILKEHNFDVI